MEGYRKSPDNPRPERRGVSRRSVIEEAKAKVPIIDLADRLVAGSGGGWRKVGDTLVAHCPLPDHEDKSPSFTIYTATNSWFCYGCLRGGDVIELVRFAWDYNKAEVATAAAMLLMEFGHEVPPRPPQWFRKQDRQKPNRDAIEKTNFDHVRRRLYRWCFEPLVQAIEDEEDRAHDEQVLWEATRPMAQSLLANMMRDGQ